MDFSLGGLIKGNSDLGKKWFLNENYITPSGNFLLIYLFLITKTSLIREVEIWCVKFKRELMITFFLTKFLAFFL